MKLQSFDIEIFNELYNEDGRENELKDIVPSVGAYCLDDLVPHFFDNAPGPMTKETAKKLVFEMMNNYKDGIIPLTHNGLHFDFSLLGQFSGEIEACAKLALNQIDIMFIVTCNKGYFIGLDTLLNGAGVESKLHTVTLNDNSLCEGFSGKLAPKMWRDGEYNAVRSYLAVDVQSPMKLAKKIEQDNRIFWFSKTGRPQSLFTKLISVKECFKLPLPDVAWMSNPPKRSDFIEWIPKEILEKEMPEYFQAQLLLDETDPDLYDIYGSEGIY